MSNINFGIDLGTTNSGIAKFTNGKVTIFKNPVGFKDFLPSVVSFRKGRIQVGDKARELISVDAMNVFSSFKRKMGTSQTYFVPSLEKEITPIDLSSIILKELLTFTGEEVLSAVITIPASFDTIQSNATKEAGYLAGLQEVSLLQEPIAACLAYSNEQNLDIEQEKKWLVYDYGGGTFDVTLVSINHRELKIIDHQGNNFLGGLDLDNAIVEKLFVPKIEQTTNKDGLWSKLTQKDDKNADFQKLYFELLLKAEEIKKELSVKQEVIVEFEVFDEYLEILVKRTDFEAILLKDFNTSFTLLENIISQNNIQFSDIERIILVGGTTFIPFIREELHRRTQILVDYSIDPTTAITVGAAFYAGTKPSLIEEVTAQHIDTKINAEVVYQPSTNDDEELIAIIAPNLKSGFYRIMRNDGAFDTGKIPFSEKCNEFVPLLKKTNNQFTVFLYDENQNEVYLNGNVFVTNGLYNISGQPLPNDISLEVDENQNQTKLEMIFKKNEILPLRKTIYKTISKTILKNSADKLIINVLEGNAGGMIGSNISIGYIEISGQHFDDDLIKGMDIELHFSISESRDLNVKVYIPSLDMEMEETFNPHQRFVSVPKILEEIKKTIREIDSEIQSETENESFEYLSQLKHIQNKLLEIYNQVIDIPNDTITDENYKIDELKRQYIRSFDDLVRHKHILAEITEYKSLKQSIEDIIEEANAKYKSDYQRIISSEKEILKSGNKYAIRSKIKELDSVFTNIILGRDETYLNIYYNLKFKDISEYKDPTKFRKICEEGDKILERQSYKEIKPICYQLYDLLIDKKNDTDSDNFNGNLGLK